MDWGMRAICFTNWLPQRIAIAVLAGMFKALSVISCGYTTLQGHNTKNSKQIFPEKELRVASVPIFTFMCLKAISIFPRSVCLFCYTGKYMVRFWEYINCSQTYECGNLDWGRPIPFLGIHKWDFRCSALSQTIHVFGHYSHHAVLFTDLRLAASYHLQQC